MGKLEFWEVSWEIVQVLKFFFPKKLKLRSKTTKHIVVRGLDQVICRRWDFLLLMKSMSQWHLLKA